METPTRSWSTCTGEMFSCSLHLPLTRKPNGTSFSRKTFHCHLLKIYLFVYMCIAINIMIIIIKLSLYKNIKKWNSGKEIFFGSLPLSFTTRHFFWTGEEEFKNAQQYQAARKVSHYKIRKRRKTADSNRMSKKRKRNKTIIIKKHLTKLISCSVACPRHSKITNCL